MTFPPDHVLLSGKLGILLIDLQEGFIGKFRNTPAFQTLLNSCLQLIDFSAAHPTRVHLYNVTFLSHGPENHGPVIPELAEALKKVPHTSLQKGRNNLLEECMNYGVRTRALCSFAARRISGFLGAGVNTHCCYYDTVVGVNKQDRWVVLPSDAHACACGILCPNHLYQPPWPGFCAQPALDELLGIYANVGTTQDLLSHITSVWSRSQSPGAHALPSSPPTSTARQAPSNALLASV